jgi:penicillin-binding protein 2
LAKDPEILKKEIEDSEESMVLVAENISHETLLVLEAKINDFSTCQIEKNTVRDYVFGESFSHLLGFTSRINKEELVNVKDYAINDYIGKIGLEKSYEEILRGKPGKVEAEKNVFGRKSGGKILSEPEAGKNLVLSVDSDLQNKIYDELKKGVKKIGSQKGAAVAIDPKTGYILALVSYPSFDNNNFSKGISQEEFNKLQNDILKPFFNRPVSGQYPPGSTIKPLIAAAGLQEKIILPDKEIYDPGFISIVNKYNPGIVYYFNDLKPHGWVSMRKAIAQSCNVYFYTIGGGYGDQQGLGSSRIKKYLELFGWGNKTGIDIPGEVNGLIPDPAWKKVNKGESWWDGDTYHLSIGQGDLKVTPLQVAVAFAAIANGGTLYQPKIVQKIIDNQTGSIEEITPTILRKNFIDAANLQVVKEGMREAVTNGIVTSLNTLPVKAAAKTGTAQISKENYYDTWVTVFAPYENPQIVLSIVVEEVPGLSTVVVPIAKEVLNWYFTQ